MNKIFTYSFYDLARSRWMLIYFLFYLLIASSLFVFVNDPSRVIISLLNVVLYLSPLIALVICVTYYYSSLDFIELLLAQPVSRSAIFWGQYLGVATSLALSLIFGLGLPFTLFGIFVSNEIWNFLVLLVAGVFLTYIFSALAFIIVLRFPNRIKGFGIAIFTWLVLSIFYDGGLLLLLSIFSDYPLENFALTATLLNPIDLSRILVLLKLDISALMGYTGAVFQRFFGSGYGMGFSVLILLLWSAIPFLMIRRIAVKRDF
ncbi:MAG: ABC transporter permease subunit [Saprospiraceae bacterium]|nr:ABC transporter permease subunit [Saprospiraceae bacterium]